MLDTFAGALWAGSSPAGLVMRVIAVAAVLMTAVVVALTVTSRRPAPLPPLPVWLLDPDPDLTVLHRPGPRGPQVRSHRRTRTHAVRGEVRRHRHATETRRGTVSKLDRRATAELRAAILRPAVERGAHQPAPGRWRAPLIDRLHTPTAPMTIDRLRTLIAEGERIELAAGAGR